MVAMDVGKQQRDRKGSNNGPSNVGNGKGESAGKQRRGKQRRIEKVSARQKTARVIALALANRNGLPQLVGLGVNS